MSIPCKMNPLGEGRGGERFPLGYKRLEYLENPGRQWIDTKVFPTRDTDFYVDFIIPAFETSGFKVILSTYISEGNYDIVYGKPNGNTPMLIRVPNGDATTGLEYGWFKYYLGQRYTVQKKGNKLFLDGELKDSKTSIRDFEAITTIALLVARYPNIDNSSFNRTKLFSFVLSQKNTLLRNFIPALDSSGRPCMFDTVTRRPFYNQGTGEFIAGMTAKQARHLAYLPATGGSLTISLPLAAAFDEKVQNALTTASGKGWIFTFYWTEVIEYLTPRIDAIVGEGNYTISFAYTAQKLSLAFALSVTSEQIDEVKNLLESELPRNLVVEIDYFPSDLTRIEYIESNGFQWIDTEYQPNYKTTMELDFSMVNSSNVWLFGNGDADKNDLPDRLFSCIIKPLGGLLFYRGSQNFSTADEFVLPTQRDTLLVTPTYAVGGGNRELKYEQGDFVGVTNLILLTHLRQHISCQARLYGCKLSEYDTVYRNFIPALDPTGAPCVFDTMSRTIFYNAGTGEFLYPGAEQAVQTLDLDLDTKSYAKLTEHGIRRLYHVPEGYIGTKDDYAAENGFKELVEPPAPLEGYWIPQWRETETQLICDWVETDPPVESLAESLEES